jgi:hypothetical protein
MNCWHCNTDLIWGGDHDAEDSDTFSMVTNLSCPKCHSFVEVYYPSEQTKKEYDSFLKETIKEYDKEE